MKNLILTLIFSLSITSYSFIGTGAFDLQNFLANQNTNIQTIQNGMKLAQQAESLKEQVNQTRNILSSAQINMKKLSDGDLNSLLDNLQNSIQDISNLDNQIGNMVHQNQDFINKYWSIYKKKPDDYNMGGYTQQDLDEIHYKLYKANEKSENLFYDSMKDAGIGVSGVAGSDSNKKNADKLMRKLKTEKGEEQTLQSIEVLINNTNDLLRNIKVIMQSNVKVASVMAQNNINTFNEKEEEKKAWRKRQKENDRRAQQIVDEQKRAFNKPITLGF